jgi:hypothetical protein
VTQLLDRCKKNLFRLRGCRNGLNPQAYLADGHGHQTPGYITANARRPSSAGT